LKDAKFALGRLYRDVYGDAVESFKWFMEAAQQGDIFAQYEIGLIYLNGSIATAPDMQKAKEWLHSAAVSVITAMRHTSYSACHRQIKKHLSGCTLQQNKVFLKPCKSSEKLIARALWVNPR